MRTVSHQVMEFPVVMLVRFWVNHHLLDLVQRPLWRVVKGRSRAYVQKILAGAVPPLKQAGCAACKAAGHVRQAAGGRHAAGQGVVKLGNEGGPQAAARPGCMALIIVPAALSHL